MKRAILLSLLALAGCYNPKLGSSALWCAADGRCPSGFYCAPDRHCWKPGDAAVGKLPVRATGSLVGGAADMRSTGYRMLGAFDAAGAGSPRSTAFVIVDGVSGQSRTDGSPK